MKIVFCAGLLAVLLGVVAPAYAADDTTLERMATCKDSWFEWQKADPTLLKPLTTHLQSILNAHGDDGYLVPKTHLSIVGLRVTQVYPNSVGMGVGISLLVDAPFDTAKRAIEKSVGKQLTKCETSDGMKACELQISEKRNVMLTAPDDPKNTSTLVGCYYFYEK